ncbi:superinfection exclusion B family protein [uncultured Shewanella sp.]|uniref:superinfection exclusion B family protein n=1 Tax=uncultured Shewanella sp. TaxID=173975 RepID=UPI002606D18F|nr:superinfection exclusion B family protein [uncultured Shewanella sp.]
MKQLSFSRVFNQRCLLSLMLWIAISCTILLALPDTMLSLIQLEGVSLQFGPYAGIGLLFSYAYLLTRLIHYGLDEAIDRLHLKRENESIVEKITLLDSRERALLREFFLQGETVLTLPQEEQTVKSLVMCNILECLGNQKHYAIQSPTCEYKISMRARGHLNRQVLRFPTGEPNKEEMQQLLKARPDFMHSLLSSR